MKCDEVQKRLGISRSTVYLWIREGKLRPYRAGRKLLFVEDDVMALIGSPHMVDVWFGSGRDFALAKQQVSQWIRGRAVPNYRLAILEHSRPDFMRARVLSTGTGDPILAVPGEDISNPLLAHLRDRGFVFLGTEESIWRLSDVRREISPSGQPYLAIDLVRIADVESDAVARNQAVDALLRDMRENPIRGELLPWTRDELYERRPD